MDTVAIVLEGPEQLALSRVELSPPSDDDVVVDIDWSGISTGTERLLWSGRMPPFPGMGYPLVPGYESVGRIRSVGSRCRHRSVGERVFVPGARCYTKVRGLFGGAAAQLVVPSARAITVSPDLGPDAILLALAATAWHAIAAPHAAAPDLIVGHGVLGRLLARLAMLRGAPAPTVWETHPARMSGAHGYSVTTPEADARRDYRAIYDVSGDANILDTLLPRLAQGGEIVLAGFYSGQLAFAFPAAFLREARLRVAAEWRDSDLVAVRDLAETGRLDLSELITHRHSVSDAPVAYRRAFADPQCLKMVLDWSAARD